jgi:dipeptidyl aminopeptidase/acylaminoacyl peptidase
MCGDLDFNVPLLNSEQMYQAVKSVGVDTELVIYPGQYHSFSTPSYLRDRLERWIAWYGKYLAVPAKATKTSRTFPAAVPVTRPPPS